MGRSCAHLLSLIPGTYALVDAVSVPRIDDDAVGYGYPGVADDVAGVAGGDDVLHRLLEQVGQLGDDVDASQFVLDRLRPALIAALADGRDVDRPVVGEVAQGIGCLLYTSPSPRD